MKWEKRRIYRVRKQLLVVGLLVMLLSMTAVPSFAQENGSDQEPKGPPSKIRGKSNVAHVLLVKKDADWIAMWPGAFGILKYNLAGPEFKYLFNGHGLTPKTEYNLIYYADPWPGNFPGALIDSGMTNNGGNLHLKGSIDLEMDLPDPADANHPEYDPEPLLAGAKIWLVLSSDYDGDKMTAWNPYEYLFEYDRIFYDDTDDTNIIEG